MPYKRVLLIEDDPDYIEVIHTVLTEWAHGFDVKSADTLAAGLELFPNYAPELILVDLNLPDSSGYETFLRVRERAPGVPVVVLTSTDDDNVALRAVEDGAQDYLVKTLVQPKHIARCLHMALSRQGREAAAAEGAASGPGTVLSFIGSKGGVGTSTTAFNVAALLAQSGFKTVLLELQTGRQGTSTLYLQAEPAYGLNWLLNQSAAAITPFDLQHCWVEALSGLHVLSPIASPTICRPLDGDHVHAILVAARRICRFVVVDLPPRFDEGVAEALKLSNSTILLVDRETAALHCGPALVEQIRTATARHSDVRLAVIDRTGLELPLPLETIAKQLKMQPLAVIPAAGAGIALSYTARTPLALLYPNDSFSLAHLALAEHLVDSSTVGSSGSSSSVRRIGNRVASSAIAETFYS